MQNENEIEIWNTTDYFIVKNCYLHSEIKNRNFGIVFDNVMDGIVENNIVENNDGGIYLWDSDNNLVSGNTVENNYIGVYLSSSDNNIISANTVRNGYEEISIWYSENNIVSSNVGGNTFMGILSLTSDGNFFYSNYMDNNGLGIYLDNSDNNLLSNNTIENNWHLGIEISLSNNNRVLGNTFVNDGLMTGYSYQNTIENNTVNGRRLVYLEGASDRIVSDAGQVILVSCENITVESLNLSKASIGVELWKTNNSKAFNNMANNNSAGISLSYSDNNLVLNNNVDNNLYDGIDLNHSNNNIVENNTVKNNDYNGIFLVDSDYNTLTNNLVENNNQGIYLVGYYQGPENPPIPPPENNCIYHNNFIKNSTQSYDNGHNYWDNGYPSGGNYWGDWTGTDYFRGENQDISGSDGIWDNSYYISGGSNLDRYPIRMLSSVAGWNLLGFSIENTPNNTFTGLTYYSDYILDYWTAPGGPYNVQDPDTPLLDNVGYWVGINQNKTVGTIGTRPTSENIYLKKGWNLVHFPVVDNTTTPNKIFAPLVYYENCIIYFWNAPSGPYGLVDPTKALKDNIAYWVWIDQDKTVTVP